VEADGELKVQCCILIGIYIINEEKSNNTT